MTQSPVAENDLIKVVHITDTHFDLDYAENSNVECGMILCCRKEHGFNKTDELSSFRSAHKLGALDSKSCDIPEVGVSKMFETIRDQIKPDAVFWTGDVVPHDIWNQNLNHTIRYLDSLTNRFNEDLREF